MSASPNLPNSLLGLWKSRVVAGAKGEGMLPSGPNPPFFPEGSGWETKIETDGQGNGTGSVNYRNWKLKGKLVDNNKVFFGGYAIDEFGGSGDFTYGEFCIMYTTGTQHEPMFIGAAKNKAGVWQAWWGKR